MKFRKQALFTIVAIAILGGSTIAVPARPACNSAAFQAILDNAFATGPAGEPSSAVGYTATVQSPFCTFLSAVGSARLEQPQALTFSNRVWVGSLTKMVTAYLALRLVEQGQLSMDATVNQFFTSQELGRLSVGCTNDCPNFSTITIRQLLNATHNLDDFVVADRNRNGLIDTFDLSVERLLRLLGLPTLPTPVDGSAFETLAAIKVRRNLNYQGFETPNFGNTGYQLLGIILERVTGESYGDLAKGTGFAFGFIPDTPVLVLDADQYTVTTGSLQAVGVPENFFGLYGVTSTPHGYTAINTRNFDNFPAGINGGAGSLIARPADYVIFFRQLIKGNLLGPTGQALFNNAFVPVPSNIAPRLFGGVGVSHGFGVFRQPVTLANGSTVTVFFKPAGTFGSRTDLIHVVEADVTVLVDRNSLDFFQRHSVYTDTVALNLLTEFAR